ncbi:DUF2406 domain-containing protein [Aspergillus chevalieri]|uniref:Uncharacterized protein n=1 Tax=Aspergillus chevalieri TaxID=182096 RepID=A0A7R7ZT28_ASPCH|nr:uncharacterized protein ACHE_80154S [Aspergillus chevalieri]BCR92254.1 hypothetical protein ACHE_80154S [Aspergillus chevalieri]
MSDSASFTSGSPATSTHHGYKKSLSSKADPNTALNEHQPMANIGSVSTFSLRSIQHTDHEGRLITEPDLSNPTRHRFERPLDTIRNFEAAIDRRRREMY